MTDPQDLAMATLPVAMAEPAQQVALKVQVVVFDLGKQLVRVSI
jgi:hypothetical protein